MSDYDINSKDVNCLNEAIERNVRDIGGLQLRIANATDERERAELLKEKSGKIVANSAMQRLINTRRSSSTVSTIVITGGFAA